MILGALTVVFAGHVLPVSARINGEPGGRVQDPQRAQGRPLPAEPWPYRAGVYGAGNLMVAALPSRRIGILLTGLGMIAGWLIGSLLLDVFLAALGPWPACPESGSCP